ncbi:hypothetical protein [Streptomyces sp. NPDC051662]|uniref:hypothetical protein n=1 Tax=Streptomyces sp. NPDC051662 TaxID=3154750 RepID=UPI00342EBD87
MAAKRTTIRRTTKTPAPAPADCGTCGGTGTVSSTVRVGRKRRTVGHQDGFCLDCFGTGTAASA